VGDLFRQFGINGKLLLAQIVNFTILVLVLRAFVWKPIVQTLEKRRERIRQAEHDAAALAERSVEDERELAAKRAAAHEDAARIIAEARRVAGEEAEAVRAEARREAGQIVAKGGLQLAKEREALESEVRERVIGLTIEAASRLLDEEISSERAAQAVDAALALLRADPPR